MTREELKQQREEQDEMFDAHMAIVTSHFDTKGDYLRYDILTVLGTLAVACQEDDTEQMAIRCCEYGAEQRQLRQLLGE